MRKPRKLIAGWTEAKTRIVVRERSDGICEKCGMAAATDMHHRKNRSQGGKWHPANIVHICKLCHIFVTEHPAASESEGFTVRSGQEPAVVALARRGVGVWLSDDGSITHVNPDEPLDITEKMTILRAYADWEG